MKNERILAKNKTISNDTWVTGLNNNDIIIGPSGSGKTTGYVIPNILQLNGSMIIADTKGNLAVKARSYLEQNGYEVYVLDFVRPERSCAYNPLDYIRRDLHGNPNQQDIVTCADALVPPQDKHEPFWDNSAKLVVTALISFVLEALPKREQNLGSVVALYQSLDITSTTNFFEEWAIEHPDSFAVKKYEMFKRVSAADKTWACINQFVAEALNIFDFKEVQTIFHRPSLFRLGDLGTRKIVLFLNISDMDRSFDRLINVFYTQVLQVLCRMADRTSEGRLKVPVRIIMDDFATNAYVPNFDKIISVIRSREVSVSIILQSLSQLETLYSHQEATTIINNCDHLLYLGGQDLDTAQYIGTRANRSPESILSMGLDEAYLFTRGRKPEIAEKIKPGMMTIPKSSGNDNTDDTAKDLETESPITELSA